MIHLDTIRGLFGRRGDATTGDQTDDTDGANRGTLPVADGGSPAAAPPDDTGNRQPGPPAAGAPIGDAFAQFDTFLDALDLPFFVLDAEGRTVAWNDAMVELMDIDRETVVGERDVGGIIYPEGADRSTLAEKIHEVPRDTHEAFEQVGLADEEYALLSAGEGHVYEDLSTESGMDLWLIGRPLFESGECVGVVEIVQEQSNSARRREELEALFDELVGTLSAFERGDFSARVAFDTDESILDADELRIVDRVNSMGQAIEGTIDEIESGVLELVESVQRTRTVARDIDDAIDDQNDSLRTAQTEMENFAANMEEVAASADEVADAVENAREAGSEGLDAIESAQDLSGEVIEETDDLVETVEELGDRMDDIVDVVDIIDDVAEQTNILALNANIEAARAGEAGEGFAVVAEEVKNLADETQSYTEEITGQIEQLRAQTDETVRQVETTYEHLETSDQQVSDAADAFERIVTAVEEASHQIADIAEVNNEQALTVEEVAKTVDDALEDATEVEHRSQDVIEEVDSEQSVAENLATSVDDLTSDDEAPLQ